VLVFPDARLASHSQDSVSAPVNVPLQMSPSSSVGGPAVDEVFAHVVPADPPPSVNALIREKVVRAMDFAMVLQEKEYIPLAPPIRPGGAYAHEKRLPDPPRAIPLANRFTELLAQQWRLLVTGAPFDASQMPLPVIQEILTPCEAFAKAMPPCRPSVAIRELRWLVDAFPCEGKLPSTFSVPKSEFVALFSRVREICNIASNLEFPLTMLEAVAAEVPPPAAPDRPAGDWPAFVNPYVQAAKEGLESLLKSSAETLIQSTLLGRDALLATIKVGLVCGQALLSRLLDFFVCISCFSDWVTTAVCFSSGGGTCR
jgi:hypothetical protein